MAINSKNDNNRAFTSIERESTSSAAKSSNPNYNPGAAGKSVKEGDYTVTYNANGYMTKKVKDGGASATGTDSSKANKLNEAAAGNSTISSMIEAAKSGDWDKAGALSNNLHTETTVPSGATDLATGKNGTVAYDTKYRDEIWSMLSDVYGYNPDGYAKEKYEAVYGEGSWDGSGTTGAAASGTGAAGSINAGTGTGTGAAGGQSSTSETGNYALTEFLKQQAAQQLEAELAGLKSAYDSSIAGLDAAADKLPQTYDAARNQAAAQNALEKRAFDERAVASGLNTGTTGQAELARGSVLQAQLAGIGQKEADAMSDIELQRAKLVSDYQSAIAEAEATSDAKLANALYNELLRVQGLEREDAQLAAQMNAAAQELAMKYGLGADESEAPATKEPVAQKQPVAPKVEPVDQESTDNTVNNGSVDKENIRKMQAKLGVPQDGLWGPQTRDAAAKAGWSTDPDKAWTAFNVTGTMGVIPEYETILKESEAGNYGSGYGLVLGMVQSMKSRGSDDNALAEYLLKEIENGNINEAGAKTIMQALGIA